MFDQNRVFLKNGSNCEWLQCLSVFLLIRGGGGRAGWQVHPGGGTQPERRVVHERGCVTVGRRSGVRAIGPSMVSQQLFLGTVLTLSD